MVFASLGKLLVVRVINPQFMLSFIAISVLQILIPPVPYCIPQNWGYYGSCTVIVHARIRRDFLVFNRQATFLFGFLLIFASGLLWQRSGHRILLVAQESKLCSGESKMSKILTTACGQAIGHSFFQSYIIHVFSA